jgi:DNA-binding PadR family transcriptional regulator
VASDPTLLVLASLADGEKHGYGMMTDIAEFAGVKLGPGTLYGAIARLEARGFIKGMASDERRQPYRLTAAGRAHLQEHVAALEPIVRVAARRLRRA